MSSSRRHSTSQVKLPPDLVAALRELAANEDIDLALLITRLIHIGLDHHGDRAC